MEGVMEALCKSGSLFEVAVPDYKQLKACHKEVRLLKELWDMIVMVSRTANPRMQVGGTLLAAPQERGLHGGNAAPGFLVFDGGARRTQDASNVPWPLSSRLPPLLPSASLTTHLF